MKCNRILILIICLLPIWCYAQIFETQWIDSSEGNMYNHANAIDVDFSGNVLITGYFQGSTDLAGKKLNAKGDTDLFVAKYNANGEILWVRTAGSDYNKQNVISEFGTAVTADLDGNVFVGGSFRRAAYFEDQVVISKGKNDFCLAKYSKNGDLLWVKSGGGNSQDVVESIATDLNGDVYVTGYYQNNALFDHFALYGTEYNNFFIAKYSNAGELIWVKNATQSGPAEGKSIDVIDENVFVSGNYRGKISINNSLDALSLVSDGVFIAQFSLDGSCTMLNGIEDESTLDVKAMNVTREGIFLTGGLHNLGKDVYEENGFIAKLSFKGDKDWLKKLPREYRTGDAIKVSSKDQIIIVGNLSDKVSSKNNSLLYVDQFGNIEEVECSLEYGRMEFNSLTIDEGSIFLAGSIQSENDLSIVSQDILVARVNINKEFNTTNTEEELLVYPNPAVDEFKVYHRFAEIQPLCVINVLDALGNIVFAKTLMDTKVIDSSVSLPAISSGIYIVQLKYRTKTMIKKIILR